VSTRDRLLAALVAVLWGLNFLAVRIGLDQFPPFFLAALRYVLLAVPVILFVRPPDVPLRWLLGYGLGFGTAQFGLLFLAINVGMPAGLSSVVLQAAAPFTVLLGALLLSERISGRQLGGIGLAVLGLGVIAVDRAQVAALLPMVLTVLAALACALGNLSSRLAKPSSPLRFALWMSVVPPLPLLALSAVMEGPATGWVDFAGALSPHGWPALAAMVYIVLLGTVVGSGIWTALLKRYPASTVAPFSMLSPVVGIAGAWLALHETPSVLALAGGAAVIGGVLVGTPRPAPATPAVEPGDSTAPTGRPGDIPSRR
jgi:DME family drug/metabolite transporter/O-acetylserine/cysteine efflux transporter